MHVLILIIFSFSFFPPIKTLSFMVNRPENPRFKDVRNFSFFFLVNHFKCCKCLCNCATQVDKNLCRNCNKACSGYLIKLTTLRSVDKQGKIKSILAEILRALENDVSCLTELIVFASELAG